MDAEHHGPDVRGGAATFAASLLIRSRVSRGRDCTGVRIADPDAVTCGATGYAAATAGSRRGMSTSRAITSRWIWEVPSYSCMIFASRISFSTGYSLMKP